MRPLYSCFQRDSPVILPQTCQPIARHDGHCIPPRVQGLQASHSSNNAPTLLALVQMLTSLHELAPQQRLVSVLRILTDAVAAAAIRTRLDLLDLVASFLTRIGRGGRWFSTCLSLT